MTEDSATPAESERDVCIVGAGPAGLTAGVFTARAGLDTVVLNDGEPILRRNAHLENFPGFPAGVNARRLLEMMNEQADRNDCTRREARVSDVRSAEESLEVETDTGETIRSSAVICTSWSDTVYLDGLASLGLISRGSKTFVDVEDDGSTAVDGLYAAGRIAGKPHQAIVAAGDGARVALTVIHDSETPFYHDWVAPENYFTGRGREVPPGCEEIDDAERERREREAREVMQSYFAQPHSEVPTQHPSVENEE